MFLVVGSSCLFAAQRFNLKSDRMELNRTEKTAVLTGNVELENDTGVIRAERVEIRFNDTVENIERLEAFGSVQLSWLGYTGTADYLLARLLHRTINLRGNVELRDGRMWMKSSQVLINARDEVVSFYEDVTGEFPTEEQANG